MGNFIVHDLIQGSQEWLDFKEGKMGSSDAASVMEAEGAFDTLLQLWERMQGGKKKEANYAMKRGTRLEPKALQAVNLMCPEQNFRPTVLQSVKYPQLIASLDGYREWMGIREILEIKCPGEKDHLLALSGKVPPKYWVQLQHQMMLAYVSYARYFSYLENSSKFQKEALLIVQRDDLFIEQMLSKELAFLDSLRNFEPPEPKDRDWLKIEDFSAISVVQKYFEIDQQIKKLSDQRDSMKDSLKSLSDHPRILIGDARFQRIKRTGSIDYEKAKQDGICLEKYRKPPIETWRLSHIKQSE